MTNIIVLGAGGIGYCLTELLTRFIYSRNKQVPIYIVDGDSVESKNLERQHTLASLGKNKAEILATNIKTNIGSDCLITGIPEFLTPKTINNSLKKYFCDGVVIFVCVDNNATRIFVENLVETLPNATMISGGNDYYKGQAQLFLRRNKKNLTPKPSEINPEITELDQFPDEISCTEAVVSEPQLLFVNNSVATAMLNLWYSQVYEPELNHKLNESILNEVIVNVQSASAHQFSRKPLKPVNT